MVEEAPLFTFSLESSGVAISSSPQRVRLDLSLEIFGLPMHAQLLVADQPARLWEILPVARQICDRIVSLSSAYAIGRGHKVACREKCSLCCHYLLPITVPEALMIWNDIQELPPLVQGRIIKAFGDAAEKVLCAEPRKVSRRILGNDEITPRQASCILDHWYEELGISCPLLIEDLCRTYLTRPIACREFVSLHPPTDGFKCLPETGCCLEIPFSVSQALKDMTGELMEKDGEIVVMAMWLPWHISSSCNYNRAFPAVKMFQTFFDMLRRQIGTRVGAGG